MEEISLDLRKMNDLRHLSKFQLKKYSRTTKLPTSKKLKSAKERTRAKRNDLSFSINSLKKSGGE
jgi:hypothetical protein